MNSTHMTRAALQDEPTIYREIDVESRWFTRPALPLQRDQDMGASCHNTVEMQMRTSDQVLPCKGGLKGLKSMVWG